MKKFTSGLLAMAIMLLVQLAVQAQTTGAIAGTVVDAAGAVVPGATVTVTGEAGQEFTATTSDSGTYNIPAVQAGFYTVTIKATGFKTSVVQNVKVDVGTPATVSPVLEAGAIEETVVVTSGAEVLQTQTATIGTSIQGRQIIETPIQSRDALDLVALLPGTNTVGSIRTSSINGLPKGTTSITIDGVDVQDNFLRSSDGFFTYVRPRIDAIDEVTVSTANPGAESSGDGAVQIKFITRRGTNDYTGSLFWQHRDESLNANNWWNNRIGTPRGKLRLNQFGGRVGGPIPFLRFGDGGGPLFDSGKDKAFFFVNYEEYRIPEASPTRTRTILAPDAQSGIFTYQGTIEAGNPVPSFCTHVSGTTYRCRPNLYQFAGGQGLPNTADPTVSGLLTAIRSATSGTGTINPISGTENRQSFNFVNTGSQVRKFFALRVDINLTKDHAFENVFNYQPFRSTQDFLNALDSAFPGFNNAGAQNSDRFSNSTALRSNFGTNIVNEARFARLWGNSGFTLVGGPEFFDDLMRGYNLNISAAGISNPTARNAEQIRTSPTYDFTDTLTWISGNHTFSFGGQYKIVKTKDNTLNQIVPTVAFGVLTQDTALTNAFTTANFPGATQAQVNEMAALYAVLTGRVSSYTQTAYLGADGKYVASGPLYREVEQRTYGLFAQDTWRIKPNLTLNLGLRWQPQSGYRTVTANFSRLENFDMVWDVSGPGNIFSPGTLTGTVPKVVGVEPGEKVFPTNWNNWAPSVGVVYSPDFKDGLLRSIFGESGRSVIRGGFSRAFVREGTLLVNNSLGLHPGGTFSASRTAALGNLTPGTLFRTDGNTNITPAPFPESPNYPITLTAADLAAAWDPDLRTGYVDSWSVGYQRELDRDTVIEFRYVGNRGKDMLRYYVLNELNTIENGFAAEFKLAQQNLLANVAAGRGTNFRYFGPGTGTSPLPIFMSYLRGAGSDPNNVSHYSGTLWANATLYNNLTPANPNVLNMAALLENNFRTVGVAAGRPVNFFNNCPTTLGFCFVIDNSEKSWYDAAVVELRRRLSDGLRVQASYTYAKAFSNAYAGPNALTAAAGTADQNNNASVTLRNPDLDKTPAQVDLRHAFKFDATWDLPIGRGRWIGGNSNWFTNALIGGWTLVPTVRWQSGSPSLMENVQLVGMTVDELQDMIGVYKDSVITIPGSPSTQVPTWLPPDVILNTIRAFNTTATGYNATLGAPEGKFIAPAGYGNCLNRSPGECGFRKLVIYGPSFFKTDLAVLKKIQFDEKRNVEFRVTMFDIFNKTNWRLGGWTQNVNTVPALGANTFGQMANGWTFQDPFGSNDPGGRVIDLMMRINF